MNSPELTNVQRVALQRKRIAVIERSLAGVYGDERRTQERRLNAERLELISMLLDQGLVPAATAEWDLLPEPIRGGDSANPNPIVEIRLAARTESLGALLQRYRSKPDTAPNAEVLRNAAEALRNDKEPLAAISVLEFLYTREIDAGRLDTANFLGLAEVRLEQKQDAAAIQLLHRMALITENPFDTLIGASDLLERYKKDAEAAEFVAMRLHAAPWDSDAKLHAARLAQGEQRRGLQAAVATDPMATYHQRADAALLLAPATPASLAGTELGLLAAGPVTPNAAEKPYYVEARAKAAETAGDESTKLSVFNDALAIAPTDQRIRVGALRAALALRRDSIAVSLVQTNSGAFLPEAALSNAERASLAEQLAAAAERLDDLAVASSYLQTAINLLPQDQRAADDAKLKAITAEQTRRAQNAARQPVISNVVDQEHVVAPGILKEPR